MGEWTETDLIIKSDELLLNGYTISPDTGLAVLNQFRQEPQEIELQEILPYDISLLLPTKLVSFPYESMKKNQTRH